MAVSNGTDDGFFKHQPLDVWRQEIRTLKIEKELSPDGLVQCGLRHVKLGSTHTCLSYTWGEATFSKLILVNGKKFWVRQNLWDFLNSTRLRRADSMDEAFARSPSFRGLHDELGDSLSDELWIDAICIDQRSTQERNEQVRLMARIYQQATQVQVYLGPAERDVDNMLHKIDVVDVNTLSDSTMSSFRFARKCRERGWNESHTEAALKLMNCPYWTRMWTRQEIYWAKHARVLCGGHQYELDRFVFVLTSAVSDTNSAMERVLVKQATAGRHPLRKLVNGFWHDDHNRMSYSNGSWSLECSEKKDKIFALLSMASDGDAVEVDYSTPVAELFFQVFMLPEAGDEQPAPYDWIALGWKLAVGLEITLPDLIQALSRPAIAKLNSQAWARSIEVVEVGVIERDPLTPDRLIVTKSPRQLRVHIDEEDVFRDAYLPPICQTGDVIFAVVETDGYHRLRTIFFIGRRQSSQPAKLLRAIAYGHYIEAFKGYDHTQYLNGGTPRDMMNTVYCRHTFECIPNEVEISVALDEYIAEPNADVWGEMKSERGDVVEQVIGLAGRVDFDIRKAIAIIGLTMQMFRASGRPIPLSIRSKESPV